MTQRPITDFWLLPQSRLGYYGAFPYGFLERARWLLGAGEQDAVLHVCSGAVRSYPYRGFGPNDRTLDTLLAVGPDYCQDALQPLPAGPWHAILIDPPYTEEDAKRYSTSTYPSPKLLLENAAAVLSQGGRIGLLHYYLPSFDKKLLRLVAQVAVVGGCNRKIRLFSVLEVK